MVPDLNNPSTTNGMLFSLINSRNIAGGFRDKNRPDHHIQLWNRWTLQSEHVRSQSRIFNVMNTETPIVIILFI